MTEEFVLLECITDNPYQPRTTDNAEHIESLARSIAADGLLQKPSARHTVSNAQLAFGHSRRKAFEWLKANWQKEGLPERYNGYTGMPLNIEELTDEDMYRQTVTENAQRADLSPIEEATAMKQAMDEFGYTSEQVGALFGKSGATVRGKIRLLDLPENARAKLQDGELSESAGRMLIVLSRMAPDRMEDALKDIIDDHEDPESVVDNVLTSHKNIRHIHEENFQVKAKTIKHLPVLTEKELEEQKAHLIAPPACTACPFYARVAGDDYCSFAQCFDRKSEAQAVANMGTASKATGIAIYDKADGEFFVMDRWEETHRKVVDKKDPDLRLTRAGKRESYWRYIHHEIPSSVAIVAVGKLCEKYKKAKAQSEIDRGRMPEDADPKEKAKVIKAQINERIVRNEYDRIIFETFAPQFVSMLDPIKSEGLLELLADALGVDNTLFDTNNEAKLTGKARIKHVQLGIVAELWERDISWAAREKSYAAKLPITELAKTARAAAERWGVTLGKGFDQVIANADIQINEKRKAAIEEALKAIVAAETEKKK